MTRLAVHGAGRMGLPIVANLAAAGFAVRAFDVRAERRAAVEAAGAQWSPDVAGVDALLTVLPGSPELGAAMLDDGLLDRLGPDADWLDLTSTAPDLDAVLADRAAARGIGYLDCGLGGGPAQASAGQLTVYVGGDAQVLDRRRPVLDAIAGRIEHVGAAGAGHLAKLLVNLLWFGQAVVVTEALLLGQRSGIEPAVLAGVLRDGPADSDFVRRYLPQLLAGGRLPGFGIDRVVEELDSLERVARLHGVPFDVSAAVAAVHRGALAQFGAADGELLAVAYLEHRVGRPLCDPVVRPSAPPGTPGSGQLGSDATG